MTADHKPSENTDDIDLFILIERAIVFFRKYRLVFIFSALGGMALGFFFYKTIPRTYKSRMVVHSFTLTNQEEIQVVKNWNALLTGGEHSALSSILNTPVEVLGKVKKIKAEEIQQVFSQVNPNGFTIDALVTDNSILPQLQKGLVYGFENNGYIKERLAVKRAGLEELIDKTAAEIKKLDSTKENLENIIGGKGHSSSSLIIDGSSINRQLIEMNEKLLSFRESLKFTNAVQVLQGFEAFRKPAGPHLIPWLIIGLMTGLALAYVYALIHSISSGLKARAIKKTEQGNT